jgi:hypothetical protein
LPVRSDSKAAQPHARRRVPARNSHTSEASAALDLGRPGQNKQKEAPACLCTRWTGVLDGWTQPNLQLQRRRRARRPRFYGEIGWRLRWIVSASSPPAACGTAHVTWRRSGGSTKRAAYSLLLASRDLARVSTQLDSVTRARPPFRSHPTRPC